MAMESDCLVSNPATHMSQGKLLNHPSLVFLFCKMEIMEEFASRGFGDIKYV